MRNSGSVQTIILICAKVAQFQFYNKNFQVNFKSQLFLSHFLASAISLHWLYVHCIPFYLDIITFFSSDKAFGFLATLPGLYHSLLQLVLNLMIISLKERCQLKSIFYQSSYLHF